MLYYILCIIQLLHCIRFAGPPTQPKTLTHEGRQASRPAEADTSRHNQQADAGRQAGGQAGRTRDQGPGRRLGGGWEGFGRRLGGAWERLGRMLGGCWEEAGRRLGAGWEGGWEEVGREAWEEAGRRLGGGWEEAGRDEAGRF